MSAHLPMRPSYPGLAQSSYSHLHTAHRPDTQSSAVIPFHPALQSSRNHYCEHNPSESNLCNLHYSATHYDQLNYYDSAHNQTGECIYAGDRNSYRTCYYPCEYPTGAYHDMYGQPQAGYYANETYAGYGGSATGQPQAHSCMMANPYGPSQVPSTTTTSAQHNHPPYYHHTDGAYAHHPPSQYPPSQYPPAAIPASTVYHDQSGGCVAGGYANGYPAQVSSAQYDAYPGSYDASKPATGYTAANKKGAYSASGPYGNDPTNTYMDYYRKLYYPYDPITGEYMKDEPPPSTNMQLSNVMPTAQITTDRGGNALLPSRYGNAYEAGGGGGSGGGGGYYPRLGDNEDSLLLCCDFLIPRPSINCLIIALFAMLVLVIIFMVVKFTIMYPSETINPETVALVDQITVLLLFGALLTLIWIFGIYFTSRRTRQQISNLLSCVSTPRSYATTLVEDGYGGYQHSHRMGTPYNTASSTSNYRYASNNLV